MRATFATVLAAAVGLVALAADRGASAATAGRNAPARVSAPHVPRFVGKIETRWLSDGRHMVLLVPYSYVDQANQVWTAPKGTMVDGASIPKVLWSLVGGPFEGKYRGPSILHDWYCDRRTRTWQDVHRMFFHAMLTAGVDRIEAQIIYAAVWAFGPRWDFQAIHNERLQADLTNMLERYDRTGHANTPHLARGFVLVGELKHNQVEASAVPSHEVWRLGNADPQTKQDLTQVFREMTAEANGPGASATLAPSAAALSLLKGEGVVTEMGPVARVAVPIASPKATPALAKRLEREAGARPMTEADLEKLADSLVRSR